MTTTTYETVKAGRGTKVHYRQPGAVQTLCGQGLGSRGGRQSSLQAIEAPATCIACTDQHTQEGAAELRARAAASDQRAADSFARSDTDGFLSQWASNMSARQYRMEATLLEDGGLHTFQGLYNEAGQRVRARTAMCRNYQGGHETKWLVLDANDRVQHWVAIPQTPEAPSKRSKMGKLGLHQAPEQAPAKVEMKGSGTGLAGAASAYVGYTRTDAGYPADAIVHEGGAA